MKIKAKQMPAKSGVTNGKTYKILRDGVINETI